jgi:5'-deoxynucleotidase YfbR-like HD superfamily hydrolase
MVEYTPEFLRKSVVRANRDMVSYFKREVPSLLKEHHANLPDLSKIFQMTAKPRDYINGGFIERIKGLYTAEEREFILHISEQFERVRLGFAYFSLLGSNQRPFEAIRLTHSQLRTGYVKTGVSLKSTQRLDEHLGMVAELAFLLFFDDPDFELIKTIAYYHDAGEPVIGDFTPSCPITKPDKGKIEMLGIRLITAARTRGHLLAEWIYDAVALYDGTDPQYEHIRSKVRDCDLLEMCTEALSLMINCPEKQKRQLNANLQEFWDYTGPRLTTSRAKRFFESLSTSQYRHNMERRDFSNIIGHALRYMYIGEPNGVELYMRLMQETAHKNEKKEAFEASLRRA